MRLLRAELRKLRRPLTAWVLTLGALLAILLAWAGLANDQRYLAAPRYRAPPAVSCADAGLPEGPDCTRQLAVYRRVATAVASTELEQTRSEAQQAASVDVSVEEPIGSGAMAAGLMASLPGLALVALLAAGHVGGEWSGRTVTTVMTAEGRRWRVLAAKAVSVWLAALATLAVMFATLAAASPVWRSVFRLPVRHPTATEQWARSWPILAHSVVTLAVFTLLAVAAAVLTRSVVGTLTLTLVTVIVGLVTAGFPAITDWTLGTWVAGWTRFPTQANVVTSFWSRVAGSPTRGGSAVPQLGWITALLCLVGLSAACWVIAALRLRRMDIA